VDFQNQLVLQHSILSDLHVGAEEIEDDGEPFPEKMKRLTQEYARLSEESKKLDLEIRKNLKEIGFEI